MVAEFAHGHIALNLTQIAVQTVGVIPVGYQLVGYLLSLFAGAAEDDAVDVRVVVGHTFQRQILVVCFDHIIYVPHILGTLIAVSGHKFHRVVHEVLGNIGNLLGHCGREHQHLAVGGNVAQNLLDVVEETHVEHFVGFVKNHRMHVGQVYLAPVDEVDETSRSGHNNLRAAAQCLYLAVDAAAPVYRQYLYVFNIFGEVGQIAGYLQAEFAGRSYDKSLRHPFRRVDALKHRQTESRRFARSGLSETHHIALMVEQMGYHHFLYRHGRVEAHLFYCPQQLRFYAKLLKSLHFVCFVVFHSCKVVSRLRRVFYITTNSGVDYSK